MMIGRLELMVVQTVAWMVLLYSGGDYVAGVWSLWWSKICLRRGM